MKQLGIQWAYHARFHCTNRLVFSIMRYIRRRMEEIIDTMTGVGTDNGTAICTGNRLSLDKKKRKNKTKIRKDD
jgi:hypothetical protein